MTNNTKLLPKNLSQVFEIWRGEVSRWGYCRPNLVIGYFTSWDFVTLGVRYPGLDYTSKMTPFRVQVRDLGASFERECFR
jgi:hypothetical protein